MRNKIASIQARLKAFSRENGQNHQLTLTRYFQERLLYRLSLSSHRESFLLKGGALLFAWRGIATRPTLDVDLLGQHTSNDLVTLKEIFQQICSLESAEDGVVFEVEQLEVGEILKEGNYSGIRIKVPVKLGKISQRLQVDIGFGDAVTPGPIEMAYPTLIPMNKPLILAYSKENLIAEKFEAMITLGELNSRMKDFYDLYILLREDDLTDQKLLERAIKATFDRRKTVTPHYHPLFDPAFAKDAQRNTQWSAFLKKTKMEADPPFSQVLVLIHDKLSGIYASLTD